MSPARATRRAAVTDRGQSPVPVLAAQPLVLGVPLGVVEGAVAPQARVTDPTVRAGPLGATKEVATLPVAAQGPRARPAMRPPLQVAATVGVPTPATHPAANVTPVAVPSLAGQVNGPHPPRPAVAATTQAAAVLDRVRVGRRARQGVTRPKPTEPSVARETKLPPTRVAKA